MAQTKGANAGKQVSMAEPNMDERVASLEVRTAEIISQGTKIDKLMDLVNEIKMGLVTIRYESISKTECNLKHVDYEKRFEETRKGQRQLFWAAVVGTVALVGWLLQQLLQIQIKLGG